MKHISIDEKGLKTFVDLDSAHNLKERVLEARDTLLEGTGAGANWRGWLDLPVDYDKEEFARIKAAAKKIQAQSKVLVVIGIGGSYMSSRATIGFLRPGYGYGFGTDIEIVYAGTQLSTSYLHKIIEMIGDLDFSVNVISKSGNTIEPAINFRIFRDLLEERYGKEGARERIYATTDKEHGLLKALADEEGYETFVIPDDVGGRFSVFTPVGLLPIAASGIDIDRLMEGARSARETAITAGFDTNAALRYAAYRYYFYKTGKEIEILANYEPSFHYVFEWWKQLFGESEGKNSKGLVPVFGDFTTDLHSVGQMIQDGRRVFIETVINLEEDIPDIVVPHEEKDLDRLNYLEGKSFEFVRHAAMEGTTKAHVDGGVPNFRINMNGRCEESLGELYYFFEFACAVSAYLLGVNPFDQPGVEFYKRNMFELLGRP